MPKLLWAIVVLHLAACGESSQAAGSGGAAGAGGAPLDGSATGGGGGAGRGGSAGGAIADGATDTGRGDGNEPPTAPLAGSIEVTEGKYFGSNLVSSTIQATFVNGEFPFVHETTLSVGACRALEFKQGVCSPACTFPDVCGKNNVCRPYFPQRVSAGALTFTGLLSPVTVRPDPMNSSYFHNELAELFADDAMVGVSAQGATIAAFTIAARGVPGFSSLPIARDPMAGEVLVIPPGADYALTWQPALGVGQARVLLTLVTNNQAHGAPIKNVLECDAPDTGSLTIARAILDAFPSWTTPEICVAVDCPPSEIVRYSIGAAKLPDGRAVELRVGNRTSFRIKKG